MSTTLVQEPQRQSLLATSSVLFVHNAYRLRGGEDLAVERDVQLLESRGHLIGKVIFDNRDIPDPIKGRQALRLAIDTVWSRKAITRILEELDRRPYDVVHFHNTFPLISPAALAACAQRGLAVVQTLHNYRLVCPNGLLFRSGRPCEDCIPKTIAFPAVLHGCVRKSRPESAVVAAMLAVHKYRGTWSKDVDVFVALTNFAKSKLVAGRIPERLITTRPNFLEPDPGPSVGRRDSFLFAGRLSVEKGVTEMLAAWPVDLSAPLVIAGDGPLSVRARSIAAGKPSVLFLGDLSHEAVLDQMRRAVALIFPSRCYENFPTTILEAFASGTPVIASRLGSTSEIVQDGHTGILFDPEDGADFSAKMTWAWSHRQELERMGANAREEYLERYRGIQAYETLIGIYDLALKRAQVRGGARVSITASAQSR